jgi:hypothetical protein
MSSKRELLKEALGALTGFLAMGWDSLNPLRDKIEAELAKPDQSIMAIWDVYNGDKILQTITAPIGWDAKNVKDNLIENHYAEHLHLKLRHSTQYSQDELAKPESIGMTVLDIQDDDSLRFIQRVLESDAPESDRKAAREMIADIRTRVRELAKLEEEDKFRMGAKAMFDWFQFRAANHYHGNPKIQAQCDAENEFVLEWAEQALEDVSPETFFEWRKLSEALAENQKLKQELSKPESNPAAYQVWASSGEFVLVHDVVAAQNLAEDHGTGEITPLYASPRPMQRLTDEEILNLTAGHTNAIGGVYRTSVIDFARAIQSAMIEKNK